MRGFRIWSQNSNRITAGPLWQRTVENWQNTQICQFFLPKTHARDIPFQMNGTIPNCGKVVLVDKHLLPCHSSITRYDLVIVSLLLHPHTRWKIRASEDEKMRSPMKNMRVECINDASAAVGMRSFHVITSTAPYLSASFSVD